MQERRATIRVPFWGRAQYCAAADLIPRDGRVTNLSERGVGLWVREPHQQDERITLTVSLPMEEEPLTATGLVRWSAGEALQGRWYPLGLEWLPLEETTRYRLRSFLHHHLQEAPVSGGLPLLRHLMVRWQASRGLWGRLSVACGWLVVIGCVLWAVGLHQQNQLLATALIQRTAMMRQLEQRTTQLQQELGVATQRLASSAEELTTLDQQVMRLAALRHQLDEELKIYQGSSTLLRREREQLLEQIAALERDRQHLAWKLRVAIREAIERRPQTPGRPASEEPAVPNAGEASLPWWVWGNRGYLVWNGHPTKSSLARVIWVHPPEPSP